MNMIHDQIVNLPVIETERLVLRPLRKSDAGLLAMYAGDKRVAQATRALPHPLPPGAIDAYIARAQSAKRSEDIWVMDGTASGLPEMLGVIWLTPMDRGQSEVTYWVAPAFWNTGLASEAVKALIGANPHGDKTYFAEVF
ncbi:MAG: GNAT family N-acetyltransferase, partial [Deltaproteobacteria bacterium]